MQKLAKKISIIIPAYNSSGFLNELLTTLTKLSGKCSVEVIVVDDGSTDNTREVLSKFPQIKYIFQKNAGPAAARNAGAKLASGDFLVFIDSDTLPEEDWLTTLEKNLEDESIGILAGSYSINNPDKILARCIQEEIAYRHSQMPSIIHAFGTFNVAISKKDFWQVGGFDETFKTASGEDNDLSYRLLLEKKKIHFDRNWKVKHNHTFKIRKYLTEQYTHGLWRAKLYFKHPNMVAGDDYTGLKDQLESGLSLVGIFSILVYIFSLASKPLKRFFQLFKLSGLLILLIQLITVRKFSLKSWEKIYFSFVMFLRAYSRIFGFSKGLIKFGVE